MPRSIIITPRHWMRMEASVANHLRLRQRKRGADHGVRVLDGDHWRRGQAAEGDIGVNIVDVETGTEGFADIVAQDAFHDQFEHSDGDELDDDGEEGCEERGEDALDDGDQLRCPDTGQGAQGEAGEAAQSWRHQDHAAGTGSRCRVLSRPGPRQASGNGLGDGKIFTLQISSTSGKISKLLLETILAVKLVVDSLEVFTSPCYKYNPDPALQTYLWLCFQLSSPLVHALCNLERKPTS